MRILLLRVLVLHVLTVIMDVVWNCTSKVTTLHPLTSSQRHAKQMHSRTLTAELAGP